MHIRAVNIHMLAVTFKFKWQIPEVNNIFSSLKLINTIAMAVGQLIPAFDKIGYDLSINTGISQLILAIGYVFILLLIPQ